ncbi:Polysaccharide transporter, PST family [Candidatus Electrothrix gigas]
MIGGSQLIRMAIGIVSTKFAAVFLGSAGVGLLGAYQSISQLGIQLAGLGINQSGVREVAVSNGSREQQQLSGTVAVLRRMCWLTGIAGTIALILLVEPVSNLTFGNTEHSFDLILLSAVILITSVAQGQMAVIQGLRRITDLVRIQIIGASAGAVASIILYVTLGINGIVPALISVALLNLCTSWYFSRRISLQSVSVSWHETFTNAKGLLSLGVSFMLAGLATTVTAYATRAIIAREISIEALGIYQAAYAISGYVLNFVLQAMGADFYPRLAGVSDNHEEMVRLVNEQTEVGLLLAAPALVAVLGFAPLIITALYSGTFSVAAELLRFFVMGCFLRVISWPMGYVQMAKGAKYWFIFSEVFFNALHIVFVLLGIHFMGVQGASVAFFVMYVLYVFCIRLITGKLIGFSWSKGAKRLIAVQVSFVGGIFIATLTLPELWSMLLAGLMIPVVGIYSLRELFMRIGSTHRLYKYFSKVDPLH